MIFGFEVLKIISVPRKTVNISFYFTELLIGITVNTVQYNPRYRV